MILTKTEFLTQLEAGRTALWGFINGLSETQLSAKRDAAGWAIQDHLIHLAIWEKGLTALLHYQPRWEAMGLDPVMVANTTDFDLVNDIIFQQHRTKSSAEVLATLQAEQAAFDQVFAPLTEPDLAKNYNHYQSQETEPDKGHPIIGLLGGDTYAQYAEHLPWMQALV
jgi:hypothetical protein